MSIIVTVKVVPSSGRQQFVLDKSGALKCYLKSPPEKGLANKELVKFFATQLHVSSDHVSIVGGLASRNKRVRLEIAVTFEKLVAQLGIEQQQSLL